MPLFNIILINVLLPAIFLDNIFSLGKKNRKGKKMDWNHVVFSGVFGGIVGGLLWSMQKKGWLSKTASIAIFIIFMIGGNLFSAKILQDNGRRVIDGIDSMIAKEDKFVIEGTNFALKNDDKMVLIMLKENAPKVYEEIKQQIITLEKEGKSYFEIYSYFINRYSALIDERIVFAPDENVIAHAKVSIKQMEFLHKKDAGLCLNFVMPEVEGEIAEIIKIAESFPKALQIERLNTDIAMIIASYGDKQPQVSSEDSELASQDIETIMEVMVHQYGEDLTLLMSPQHAKANKEKSCEMLIEMNKKFIGLPTERAARSYRQIMRELQM
ncbi:hypothetical protein [Xenorhabdus szentirmaii]|uniref:hypothetical protein n=1 Tax=Xenorhabdus szentirmaii TaxID=290112 RepID=UPI0019C0E12C|nr:MULTISPECIES: hypothetical protein [unclassified Xenorhabdus]MBD2793531.1 hypothetical protein [Xenorhabdus sp. CUL]MBD2825510.1 hypothetical protein [Xenorhabdus sp. 5]